MSEAVPITPATPPAAGVIEVVEVDVVAREVANAVRTIVAVVVPAIAIAPAGPIRWKLRSAIADAPAVTDTTAVTNTAAIANTASVTNPSAIADSAAVADTAAVANTAAITYSAAVANTATIADSTAITYSAAVADSAAAATRSIRGKLRCASTTQQPTGSRADTSGRADSTQGTGGTAIPTADSTPGALRRHTQEVSKVT